MTEKYLVAIPAKNAEKSIGNVVSEARRVVPNVLVVDDGSSDRTGEVARTAGATVVRHEVNRKKGAALKTAFDHALKNGYTAVITLDADGQHLPSDIPNLIAVYEQEQADLVIGSRAHLFEGMVPRRRRANRFSAWAVGFAAGAKSVDDAQSGFRVYSDDFIRQIHGKSDGFDYENEVIVRAGRAHLKIVMAPINLGFIDGVSTSHYKPVQDTLKIFWTVSRTAVGLLFEKQRPQADSR
jgi:glycosyltransferase involved in cell wall biosynthesis